jgi:hypothetical protein
MKRIAAVTALSLAMGLGLLPGTAIAGTPVEVSLARCYFAEGGEATVPAGSDVTVRLSWLENNRGRVQNFLNAQTTTADIDGAPIPNASDLWGPIEPFGDDFYVSHWRAFAGTLENAGDSVTLHMQITLSRAVPEGRDPDTGEKFKAGPGPILPEDFGCKITAS